MQIDCLAFQRGQTAHWHDLSMWPASVTRSNPDAANRSAAIAARPISLPFTMTDDFISNHQIQGEHKSRPQESA